MPLDDATIRESNVQAYRKFALNMNYTRAFDRGIYKNEQNSRTNSTSMF